MEEAREESADGVCRQEFATAYGTVRVAVAWFYERSISVTIEPHVITQKGKIVLLPAGTFYLYNSDLARRTTNRPGGPAEYMLVREAYDLRRLCEHVCKGAEREEKELVLQLREIRAGAEALLAGEALTPEERKQAADMLAAIAKAFQAPKRAPRKLKTGEHLRKAAALVERAAQDPSKIAPSSMVAYAAGYQAEKRLCEVRATVADFRGMSNHTLLRIRDVHERIEAYWRFLCGSPARILPGVTRETRMRELFAILSEPERGKSALKLIGKRLEYYRSSMLAIAMQPYASIAQIVAYHTEQLAEAVGVGDREQMKKIGREIRQLLRRMRLIRHLEMQVVAPLAFYLRRKDAKERSASHRMPRMFRVRLRETMTRIQSFGPKDMRGVFKSVLLDTLRSSEEAFAAGDFVRVKEAVQNALLLLADPDADEAASPVHS